MHRRYLRVAGNCLFFIYLYVPFFCRIAAIASPHSTAADFAAIVGPKWVYQNIPCNFERIYSEISVQCKHHLIERRNTIYFS